MRTGSGLDEEWKDYRWTPTGLLGYMWTPCGLPQDLQGSEKYTYLGLSGKLQEIRPKALVKTG